MCRYVHTRAGVCGTRDVRFPGAEVIGGFEAPDIGKQLAFIIVELFL